MATAGLRAGVHRTAATTLSVDGGGGLATAIMLAMICMVGNELVWMGGEGAQATVTIPAGGVERVRSLERVEREYPDATLSGRPAMGRASMPAVPELGATRVWMWDFTPSDAVGEPEPGSVDGEEFVVRIRALEAER